MDEKIISRAKIIYDRDNNSPLFLRVADAHLLNNEPQAAISILESGLKIFPDHPVAFILLSKAYHQLGNNENTESYLKKTSDILNSSNTFKYYKNEFKLPDKQISPFDSSRGNVFINSTDEFDLDEEVDVKSSKPVEDNLQQIAEKLINTRLEKNDVPPLIENTQQKYNPDKGTLASETLANIYLSQNRKNEAIKIYELLADRDSNKREYFLEKIKMLKSE